MFCVFLRLFVAIIFSSVANAEEIARGQVIPKVTGKIDAQFSYALYLPSYYTPEKKFPVIYAFEPAARGAYPVERFKEAAEKFGYVIIASNSAANNFFQLSTTCLMTHSQDFRLTNRVFISRVFRAERVWL
jgi:hypothetical protein